MIFKSRIFIDGEIYNILFDTEEVKKDGYYYYDQQCVIRRIHLWRDEHGYSARAGAAHPANRIQKMQQHAEFLISSGGPKLATIVSRSADPPTKSKKKKKSASFLQQKNRSRTPPCLQTIE